VADTAIAVVQYDPEWPRLFQSECALLEGVLAPWLEGGIHHVGSTAVPGLAAKPLIDMIAGVRDLDEAQAAFEPLAEQSYRHDPTVPGSHTTLTSRRFASREWGTASISQSREATFGGSGSSSAMRSGLIPSWPRNTRH
jgi:GrpB-like predicted nucleotidyltransferase (UPF0157 family)